MKTVIALSTVLGIAAPALASAGHDLGTSRPGATAVHKKKVEKKEEIKKEEGPDGMKKEEKVEKTEEAKP